MRLETDTGQVIDISSGNASRAISLASGQLNAQIPVDYWDILYNSAFLKLYDDDNSLFNEYVISELTVDGLKNVIMLRAEDLTSKLAWRQVTKEWYVFEPGDLVEDMIGTDFNSDDITHDHLTTDVAGWTSTGAGVETQQVLGGDVTWDDYGFAVRISVASGTDYAVLFRYIDSNNHYRFQLDASANNLTARLYRVVAGTPTQIGLKSNAIYAFDESSEHYIRVSVRLSTFTFWIYNNGAYTKLLEVSDGTHGTGSLYYYTDGTEATFDDVSVMDDGHYINHYKSKKHRMDVVRDMADFKWKAIGKAYDFWVESPNKLYFKERKAQVRHTGITYREGQNINDYTASRLIDEIKNKIIAEGSIQEAYLPWDLDMWTEGSAGLWDEWSISTTSSCIDIGGVVGTAAVRQNFVNQDGNETGYLFMNFSETLDLSDYELFHAWIGSADANNNSWSVTVMLSSDVIENGTPPTNYFSAGISGTGWLWHINNFQEMTKYVGTGSTDWSSAGSPDWASIKAICLKVGPGWDDGSVIDGFYFKKLIDAKRAERSDAASIARWEQRDMPIDDDTITESQQAIDIAEYELAKRKEPPWRIKLRVETNYAVIPGKVIKVEIPSRNIDDDMQILSKTIHINQDIMELEVNEYRPRFTHSIRTHRKATDEVRARTRAIRAEVI